MNQEIKDYIDKNMLIELRQFWHTLHKCGKQTCWNQSPNEETYLKFYYENQSQIDYELEFIHG